jgi:site-specific DNA recombinase
MPVTQTYPIEVPDFGQAERNRLQAQTLVGLLWSNSKTQKVCAKLIKRTALEHPVRQLRTAVKRQASLDRIKSVDLALAVEPIVSVSLWQAVQARLQSVRRRAEVPTRGRGPKFLLSSLLRCGLCHRRFVVRDATRCGCPAHRVQGCSNALLVARTLVEEKILSGIRHDLFSPEGIECFVKETTCLLRERQRAQHPDRTAAQQQLAKVEREITNIMMAIKQGILTASTKQALEHAEAERARLLAAPVPHAKTLDTLIAFLPNATARYRTLVDGLATLPARHIDQAREQIKALVGDITLWPTPAGHLEAELTGNYAGFLKLAVGQRGQPYGPYGPQNNGLYPPQ